MVIFLMQFLSLLGIASTTECESRACPGDFPTKTLYDLFGHHVKTCCSPAAGENSFIFNYFCDVSSYVLATYVNSIE